MKLRNIRDIVVPLAFFLKTKIKWFLGKCKKHGYYVTWLHGFRHEFMPCPLCNYEVEVAAKK